MRWSFANRTKGILPWAAYCSIAVTYRWPISPSKAGEGIVPPSALARPSKNRTSSPSDCNEDTYPASKIRSTDRTRNVTRSASRLEIVATA